MAKKGGVLRAVYGIFFALLTLFVGGLFIRQVWSIYRSMPESPYTVENISKYFQEISIPVWVWLGALAVNILLALLIPEKKKPLKAAINEKEALRKVKKRVPTEGEYFEKAYALSKRQTAFRAVIGALTAIFMLTAAVLCALTLLDVYYRPAVDKPFFAEHNGAADKILQTAVLSLLALTIGGIAATLFSVSRRRERNGHLAIIVDSKRVTAQEATGKTESTVVEEPLLEEATLVKELVATEVVEEKRSPWAEVIHSIIRRECLGAAITREEIDGQIQEVLQGFAAKDAQNGEEIPEEEVVEKAVVEEAQTEELPVREVEKEKKRKPLVKERKGRKNRPKARKACVVLVRVGLAAAGIALVVVGVCNGGMRDVLMKAINICTQCIGLG